MARIKLSPLIGFFLFFPVQLVFGQSLNVGFHINGLENKSIVIGYYEGNKQYLKDTLILDKEGKAFWLNNSPVHEGLYFVILPGSRYFDILIGDNQKFEIFSDTIDLVRNMRILPEGESSRYLNYQKAALHLQIEFEKQERKLKMESSDSVTLIRQKMRVMNQNLEKLKDSLLRLYPGSLTSKILKLIKSSAPVISASSLSSENLREQYQIAIRNFPDAIDLTDNRLIFTPYLWPWLDSYFNHLLIQKNDSLISAIQELMIRAKPYNDYYDFFRRWLLENYSQRRFPGSEKTYVFVADEYYLKSPNYYSDSTFMSKLNEKIRRTRLIIPGAAPLNLDLPDTSAKIISFMQLRQKDIILFFYDSECGPCKYTRSEIIALLNRLDSRNIAVYAVNMNNNRSEWMKFIKTTGKEWIHVCGYLKKQELSSEYMLEFLPGIFLIGPDKKIIAGNISFPETEKILRSKYSFFRNNR